MDATNIERNLYLTMQLMELDIPMVLALNMMDEVRGNGGTIRHQRRWKPCWASRCVPISAGKNEGMDELVDHAIHVAKYQERPGRLDFCGEEDHGGAVHRCIHGIIAPDRGPRQSGRHPAAVRRHQAGGGRRAASMDALSLDENEEDMIEHIVAQMEQERGLDRAAAMADMRYPLYRAAV